MSSGTTKSTAKKSSAPKLLKTWPAKEICWVHHVTIDSTNFYTTSNQDRTMYFLYQETPDGLLLLHKAKTPTTFNEIVSQISSRNNNAEEKPKRPRKSK